MKFTSITADAASLRAFSLFWASLREKKNNPPLYHFLKRPLAPLIAEEDALLDELKPFVTPAITANPNNPLASIFSLKENQMNAFLSELFHVDAYDEHISSREFLISHQIFAFLNDNPQGKICFFGGGIKLLPYYLACLYPNTPLLDLDTLTVNHIKREWLLQCGYLENTGEYPAKENHYRHTACELTVANLFDKLISAGFLPTKQESDLRENFPPIFLVAEGTTAYMSEEEVSLLLHAFKQNAAANSQFFMSFTDNNQTLAASCEVELLQQQPYRLDIPEGQLMQYCEQQHRLHVSGTARQADSYYARFGTPLKQLRRENYLLLNVSPSVTPKKKPRAINDVPLIDSLWDLAQRMKQEHVVAIPQFVTLADKRRAELAFTNNRKELIYLLKNSPLFQKPSTVYCDDELNLEGNNHNLLHL